MARIITQKIRLINYPDQSDNFCHKRLILQDW
jgi:hypothetical protein